MTVRIEEVSQSTWRTIAALKVSESQHTFIEDNTTSLLEAAYDTSLHWVPLACTKKKPLSALQWSVPITNKNKVFGWIA